MAEIREMQVKNWQGRKGETEEKRKKEVIVGDWKKEKKKWRKGCMKWVRKKGGKNTKEKNRDKGEKKKKCG